jgi:hypothetical protein
LLFQAVRRVAINEQLRPSFRKADGRQQELAKISDDYRCGSLSPSKRRFETVLTQGADIFKRVFAGHQHDSPATGPINSHVGLLARKQRNYLTSLNLDPTQYERGLFPNGQCDQRLAGGDSDECHPWQFLLSYGQAQVLQRYLG